MKLPKDRSEVVASTIVDGVEIGLVKHTTHIEAFTLTNYRGETLRWNVTKALELVAAGRVIRKERLSAEVMLSVAENNEWTDDGVANADPSVPGIAAPVVENGAVMFVLIDGIHRCVRSIVDLASGVEGAKPFEAWLLTADANRECLMIAPDYLVPATLPDDLLKGDGS